MMSDRIGCLLKEKCPTLLMGSVNLESSNLLANLVAKGVITQTEKKFIKAQGPDFKQVETLVDILLTKCDEDVYKFIDALEDSKLYGVARELRSLCKEEASHTTGGATGGRQEKTVSLEVEVSAEVSNETDAISVGTKVYATSDTGESQTEGTCERISPSGSKTEETVRKDTYEPHSSSTSDTRRSREEGNSSSNSERKAVLKLTVDIIRTTREQLNRGDLDEEDALLFLPELLLLGRDLMAVRRKSILFIVRCPSLAALYDLKEALESGRLRDSFIRTFLTSERLTKYGILSADAHMSLDEKEYIQCERELKAAGDETAVDRLVQTHGQAYSADSQLGQFQPEGKCTTRREVEDKSGDTPMTDSHKGRISRCYNWLAGQVQDEHIVEQLMSEHILTEYDRQLIREKSVPAYRVGKLLDILLQKPDCAFHGLVKALKNTKQRELARLLTRKKKSMHLSVKLKSFKTRHSTTTKAASRRFLEDIVRLMEEQWHEVSIRGTMVDEMVGTRFFPELLKMGTIEGFGMGCIYVALILSSLEALENLIGTISKETLQNAFMDTYLTPYLLEKHGVESADIEMSISSQEYEMCKEELLGQDMQTKMEKLDIEGDVERRLDEPAQEEESRHHSPASKHDPKRLIKKWEFEEPLRIGEKLTKVKPAASGLRSTKASSDPEMQMLEYHERCIRRLDASKLEAKTVIDRLLAVDLFTRADVRDIMQLEDKEEAMRFLWLVIKKPDRAFDELVNALLETGQRDLADHLIASEYGELRKGVHRDDQFLTGEACKLVETTAKHERGHTCRFIQLRLYQSHYLRKCEVTRRVPYQAVFSKPELLEGETRRKDNVYETNHKRRGKAVIFVEQEYPAHLAGLVVPLQDLGFEVEPYTGDWFTMIGMLRTVAKEDHTDADCFLCVVLCYDDMGIEADELLHPFESDNCPSLAGKPKIFIIENEDPYVNISSYIPPGPDYLIWLSSTARYLYCASMEQRRVALLKSRSALVIDLDVRPTLHHLMSKFVITPEESQTILAEKSNHDKRRILLDLIPGRGDKAFNVFIDYLASNQPWLSDYIKQSLATVIQEELGTLLVEDSQQLSRGGFDELLATALNEMIRKNGEEDFVHVCVEAMRARLKKLIEARMSEILEVNFVATTFTKDLYLLPAQGSSSKTVTETHQKGKVRYLQTDPLTSRKQQCATSSTKGVYSLEQRMESGDVVKKVAGEEDT